MAVSKSRGHKLKEGKSKIKEKNTTEDTSLKHRDIHTLWSLLLTHLAEVEKQSKTNKQKKQTPPTVSRGLRQECTRQNALVVDMKLLEESEMGEPVRKHPLPVNAPVVPLLWPAPTAQNLQPAEPSTEAAPLALPAPCQLPPQLHLPIRNPFW